MASFRTKGGAIWPGRGPFHGDRFVPKPGGFSNFVFLDQQYIEIVNDGDPASKFVRLDQQYIEIVCTFGTVLPPPKKDPPGQLKKASTYLARRWKENARRATIRGSRRYGASNDSTWYYPTSAFIAYAANAARPRNVRRVISSGNDGHTVRMREG